MHLESEARTCGQAAGEGRRAKREERHRYEGRAPVSFDRRHWYDFVKRPVDLLLSAGLLIILAPVMAGIALGIRRSIGGPVLFRQQRAGRAGASFTLIKFRTMDMRDARCCEMPERCIGLQFAPGTTMSRFSAMLRRTGLDELPQLINIIRGEMSFVGPRPLLERYVGRYTAQQRRRLEVLPGITGLAQVNGRTDLSWDERLDLDIWYVDHRSPGLDATILWRTVHASKSGAGFSQSGSETGLEFLGVGVEPGHCPVTGLRIARGTGAADTLPARNAGLPPAPHAIGRGLVDSTPPMPHHERGAR
jgi:lipopolysaccharide/colanic/teichoic acid biosynthesis glycosyltransferase